MAPTKQLQPEESLRVESISIDDLQDWQSNAFDEHTKVCTELKNVILNCWELLETPPEEINENLYDILNKLRDILEPIVEKIYKEGD